MRGVQTSAEESLIYNYWTIILRLLQEGIPWEFIHTLSESELFMILGILGAISQKEQEDQEAASHKGQSGISGMLNLGGWR